MKQDLEINSTDKLIFELEMLQIDYNEAKIKALRKQIAEKYNMPLKNVCVSFVPVTVDNEGNKISLTSDTIKNIQNPEFQQKLFKEYLDLKGITDVNLDEIIDIDKSVNAFIDFDAYSRFKSYRFKYVKWDNYLSYGKGNYFDFTKLKGLVLLNGQPENQAGKSTFAIDLLRFALFGKADKSPSLDSVFNKFLPEETEVMVEAGIEIDGVDYVIRRTITRPALKKRTSKSKAKQKIEYFRLINGDYELIENCEAESATQTNNIIRESVGSMEDFNLVISANSYTLGDLLRMGQTDRSKLFSRWLGLVTIEEKDKIAKDLYKSNVAPQLLTNKYDKKTLTDEIDDYKVIIENDNSEISKLQAKQNETSEKIIKYNDQKTEVLKQRREISTKQLDVATVEYQMNCENDELILKRGLMKRFKEEYFTVENATFDLDEQNERRKQEIALNNEITSYKAEINQIKVENKRIETLIEQKICPNCGHEVSVSEKQDIINENKSKIEDLIQKGVSAKEKLDKITEEIRNGEIQRANVEKLNNLKLKMSAVKVQIDNCKLKLEKLQSQKDEIEKNKENIQYNNEIDNKIRLIETNIANENKIKEDTIKRIQEFNSEIKNSNLEIEKRKKVIVKLTEEEKIIRNWSIYQELIGKNGIVKIALKRALPIINNEIARILQGLVDFEVEIVINDDGKVSMNLKRNGHILDLTYASSGYEGTMASLALRMALSSLGNMGKPNFLVLDEVLSGVAVSNHDNIKELYKRIINNYDFIIHICHEATIEDIHEHVITVTKKNDISVIENIK